MFVSSFAFMCLLTLIDIANITIYMCFIIHTQRKHSALSSDDMVCVSICMIIFINNRKKFDNAGVVLSGCKISHYVCHL